MAVKTADSNAIQLQDMSEAPETSNSNNNNNNKEQQQQQQDTISYPQGIRLILITIALILSIFLSALDSTIIATAIPAITDTFGHLDDVTWYSSAYALTNFAFLSSWGKGYKYFPLKGTFLLAGLVFEIGNVICALAPNSIVLIAGRAISGMGGAGIMSGAFIIIAVTARPQIRAVYTGIIGATFGCASVVGPLLGGVLTDRATWRWCFWISLPIWVTGATMIIFSLSTLPQSPPVPTTFKEKLVHMDFTGTLLATAAGIAFILAMYWSGSTPQGWSSGHVVGCLVAFSVLVAIFVLNEWQMGTRAMVRGHLLKKPAFAINLVYGFFLSGLYFPLLYSLPIQFQSIDNQSASQSGVRLIPLVLGISVFTMVSNALVWAYRRHLPLIVLGAVAGTVGAGLIYSLDEKTSIGKWIGYELVTALGIGLALQLPMISNQALVTPSDIPEATAITLFVENLGTTLFVAAGQAAFTSKLISSLAANAPDVDAATVVRVGATQLRQIFDPADIQGILMSYLEGCKVNHAVSLACGGAATFVSLVMAVPVAVKRVKIGVHKPHVP